MIGLPSVAALAGAEFDVLVVEHDVIDDSMRWVPRGGAEMSALVVHAVDSNRWGANMMGGSIFSAAAGGDTSKADALVV
jgi:hypothetical protein